MWARGHPAGSGACFVGFVFVLPAGVATVRECTIRGGTVDMRRCPVGRAELSIVYRWLGRRSCVARFVYCATVALALACSDAAETAVADAENADVGASDVGASDVGAVRSDGQSPVPPPAEMGVNDAHVMDAAIGDIGLADARVSDPDASPLPVPDVGAPPIIDGGMAGECATPREMFERTLWPQLFEPRCLGCHSTQGVAGQTALGLVSPIERPETHLADNFDVVSRVAAEKLPAFDGRALLELKPIEAVPHGGTTVLVPDGPLHHLLVRFIDRLDGAPCDGDEPPPPPEVPYYDGVEFIEPLDLLRRIAFNLAGRLPTPDERARVAADGLEGVRAVLADIMDTEPFLERVKEGFDDILLIRGYTASVGAVLAWAFFPNRHWVQATYEQPESYDINDDYNEALRSEPVELIAHIVRNNRPFTEILTADYTVMSPYTARGYGVFDDIVERFVDPTDPFEFIEVRMPRLVARNSGRLQPSETGFYPHAGILSMPQFLHRYESTDTNRNRARARFFYQLFLGFDVMASAPAVNDSAAVTARFDNPTMEAPDCVSCHLIIDPLAGLFQDFDNAGDFYFRPTPWFDDMFPPGFEAARMPPEEKWRALQWLGEQAATDDRFAVAMAEHVYYILTQDRVLLPPQEADPNVRAARRGYQAQREAINRAAVAFRQSDFNLKALFESLVFSEFYRAHDVAPEVDDPDRLAELEVLGLGALLTPEQLIRKSRLIFGVGLPIDPRNPDQFRSTYLLYGGTDFLAIPDRAKVPSGAMGALMRIHANDLACKSAMRAFWGQAAAPQPLFPHVESDTVDEAAVRANLVHLHGLILGQHLAPDHPEIDRSYGLFSAVQREGAERVAQGEDRRLVYECRRAPDLPEGERPPDDDLYVMRSWQAVLAYLLRRPEFLLQ